jgi:hypothetical protein
VSTSAAPVAVHTGSRAGSVSQLRGYFLDRPARVLQTGLGFLWLLDGGLQFQSFMYSRGFVAMIKAQAVGQPGWAAHSIIWAANLAGGDLGLSNTVFALIQVLIGAGLLWRPTVKAALCLSFAWALIVWWFGEGFGMMLMGGMAAPLGGAPGAVVLYVLIGLLAWPTGAPGGLLGLRGAKIMWASLWLVMAWLWLQSGSSAPNAISGIINAAPSGMSWLSSLQDGAARLLAGNGVGVALILAATSAMIGVGVATGHRVRELLTLAVLLNLAYWLLGQGLGGIFQGGATDPNAGPLFILLSYGIARLEPPSLPSAPAKELSL